MGIKLCRGGKCELATHPLNFPLTLKFPTWQVMLQSRKSKELTVNFSSCGSYDLIRYYALNLTSSRGFPNAQEKRRHRGSQMLVHGYPKGAPGGAWLSSIRVLMCQVKSSNECNPYAYSRRKTKAPRS